MRGSTQFIRLQKYLGPICGEWPTHDEAVVVITIDGAQTIRLRWTFDAIGHNIELEIVCKDNNGGCSRVNTRILHE